MYVCVCKGVTNHHIRMAVAEGARSVGELRQCLGVCSQCGRCGKCVKEVFGEALAEIEIVGVAAGVAA